MRGGARGRALCTAILLALTGFLLANGLRPGPVTAASPFQWRGVIQGQYGPQFSPAERLRLLRFMAGKGFNAYVHAPKGDPYQRTLWRVPYPAAQQATFAAEQQLAASLGIEWIPNLSPADPAFSSPGDDAPPGSSPGAPICFSSDADLGQLLAKLEPFRLAGARTFMVSLDDVKRRFSCSADLAAYGNGARGFGRANGDLLTRLRDRLIAADPAARLLTVASDYRGTSDSAYLRGLRERLGPGVEVMWTGPEIESRPFGPAEADSYAALIGRTPIVWENWTTNDDVGGTPQRPGRIFLGPYARRPSVAGHVGGFFFNPANQADLNFLPLATAGDWMLDPSRYRPRRSFLRQVRQLAGRRAPALRAFAEASYSSSLRGNVEAPTLRRRIRGFLRAEGRRGGGAAALRLRRELRLAASAGQRLRRVPALRPFIRQARPVVDSVQLNVRAGLLAIELLRARGASEREQLRRRVRRARRAAASWPSEAFGNRSGLYGMRDSVIDDFVSRVRRIDRRRG